MISFPKDGEEAAGPPVESGEQMPLVSLEEQVENPVVVFVNIQDIVCVSQSLFRDIILKLPF